MNLLEDAPQERFDRLRYIELKHGRVCMLAVAGYLTTAAGIRVPGYISFSQDLKFTDIPSGLDAFPAVPGAGIAQMIAFILLLEMGMRDYTGKAEFIGDYRNDHVDFGWDKYDEKTKLRKRAIELNNGRAAMMGITGLVTHEMMGNLGLILPGK
jgi:Chlorophyll A-B binding protein